MKTIYTISTLIIIILFSLTVNANNPESPTGVVYQLTINSNDLSNSKKVILRVSGIEVR